MPESYFNPVRPFARFARFSWTAFTALFFAASTGFTQVPEWIWAGNEGKAPADNEVRYFRKAFDVAGQVTKAVLSATGDDEAEVFLNGKRVISSKSWNKAVVSTVTPDIVPGGNVLAVRGKNSSGDAAIIARLEISFRGGKKQVIVTDTSWQSSAEGPEGWLSREFADNAWNKAVSRGKLGVAPWGDVMAIPTATPAEKLAVARGFKVELLRSAQADEGSWVAMTVDSKGRLIISPQGTEPMRRITLDAKGQIAKMESIEVPLTGAMGLLYANDSLYANGQGKDGYHLYRLRDSDGDDQYDKVELLRKWNGNKGGNGEHGAHGIVLGPDKQLYVVCGNFVDVPDDILSNSPHKNYADDMVLPRMEDGNGFGAGRKPPGGYVVRMDLDGKNAQLFASGQRNTYDIAFSPAGELFGFDSDMEWDWGAPWYRPTRVYHIVSGGDQGFREGSAKWPEYYHDSLPATVNIGIGSPTGVKFGTGAKFPKQYQDALFIMDWSYGRILAAHLSAKGASYTGRAENFVQGKPLNVTDLEVGPDGALYFTTGGRGTQSGLYRVSYVGEAMTETTAREEKESRDARSLRAQLETFHGKQDPKAVATAWPHLRDGDRHIRYAARIAIESQPVREWQQRALEERDANASVTALLALARFGEKDVQEELIASLGKLEGSDLNEEQKLAALRVLEVSFVRMGRPNADTVEAILERLQKDYPNKSWPLNRELSQILIYLEAPSVVGQTIELMTKAETQEEQLHYMVALRNAKEGWTLDRRKHYFSWFKTRPAGNDAGPTDQSGGSSFVASTRHPAQFEQWFADVGLKSANGASYPNFLKKLRADAIARLSDNERGQLATFLIDSPATAQTGPKKEHKFVREWKMSDFADEPLTQPSKNRNYENGREAFTATQCIACHRLNNEGGAIGADLSGAGAKYNRRDLLESILEPSKVISDQYQNMIVTTKDDEAVTGRIVEDTDAKIVIVTNPLTNDKTELKKTEIKGREASKVSPMPEGLVNILTREEILDLIAYMESSGRKEAAMFGKP